MAPTSSSSESSPPSSSVAGKATENSEDVPSSSLIPQRSKGISMNSDTGSGSRGMQMMTELITLGRDGSDFMQISESRSPSTVEESLGENNYYVEEFGDEVRNSSRGGIHAGVWRQGTQKLRSPIDFDEDGEKKASSWWQNVNPFRFRTTESLDSTAPENEDGVLTSTTAKSVSPSSKGTSKKYGNDHVEDFRYTSFEDGPSTASRRDTRRLKLGGSSDGGCHPSGAAATLLREPTAEDALEKKCSFFFSKNEESVNKNRRHYRRRRLPSIKALLRPSDPSTDHSTIFNYHDAVDVTPPAQMKLYRSRYQQLNQDLPPKKEKHRDEIETHDLELTMTTTAHNIVQTVTAEQSSLYYYQHGRLLMRLPCDQVRLVQDPDLEAGILSVVQWRKPGVKTISSTSEAASSTQTTAKTYTKIDSNVAEDAQQCEWANQPHENRFELQYVLTVDDDLYRRLFSEINDAFVSDAGCGLKGHCCDNESKGDQKVNIRVALAIIGVVMTILFMATIAEGPTD